MFSLSTEVVYDILKILHREAEALVTLANEQGLVLRSEPGIPTFISNHRTSGQTTVDLQWMIPKFYDWATVCCTDVNSEDCHFFDHRAIITEIDLPSNPLHKVSAKPYQTGARRTGTTTVLS